MAVKDIFQFNQTALNLKKYTQYHLMRFLSFHLSENLYIHFINTILKIRCLFKALNPIQDQPFRGCSPIAWGEGGGGHKGPIPKFCHTYLRMTKLDTVIPYLKKIQKIYLNHVTHFLSSTDISIFSSEISYICYLKNAGIGWTLTFNSLAFTFHFLESLKVVLINMVAIYIISSKLATLSLLKTELLWIKVYAVKVSVHVTSLVTWHVICFMSCHFNHLSEIYFWYSNVTKV